MKQVANTKLKMLRAVAFAGFAMLVASCTTMSKAPTDLDTSAQQSGNDRSRAERVFLYQSRIANQLLDHYPLVEVFEQADPILIAAEARMTESCGYLTEAVLAHLEGHKPSLGLKFRVMNSIDECERSARTIEQMLKAADAAGATEDSI